MIAAKFISNNKPILVRYLWKIEDCHSWVKCMKPLTRRFEPHLDGEGVNKFMSHKEPERLLWRHVKFMRDNWRDMTDETSHRRLMAFDSKSKAENVDPWP